MAASLHLKVHSASLELAPAPDSVYFCVAEVEQHRLHTSSSPISTSQGSTFISWEEVRCGDRSVERRQGTERVRRGARRLAPFIFLQASTLAPQDLECPVSRPHAQRLKLVLFRPAGGDGHEYVAAGSLGLDPFLESDTHRHRISLPVVDEVGKHAGEVACTLSFSPSEPAWGGPAAEAAQQQQQQQLEHRAEGLAAG